MTHENVLTDANGMLKDIEVQEIEEITEAPSKQNKIRDVEYFFRPALCRLRWEKSSQLYNMHVSHC